MIQTTNYSPKRGYIHIVMCLILSLGSAAPVYAQSSDRYSIIEIYTGSWCGFCPDAAVVRDTIIANHQDRVIPVEVHSADAMSSIDGDAVASFFGPAYPTATIDRQGAPIGRTEWSSTVNSQLQAAAGADVIVEATYDPISRRLSGMVSADFTGNLAGDLRFGVMVLEDGVVGSGPGYDQSNFFDGTLGHPFHMAGNPIIGYGNRDVLRAMPLGAWGRMGSLPGAVATGETYSQGFPTRSRRPSTSPCSRSLGLLLSLAQR